MQPLEFVVGRYILRRAFYAIFLCTVEFTNYQRQELVKRLPSVWKNPIAFLYPRLPPFLLDIFNQIVLPTGAVLYHQPHLVVICHRIPAMSAYEVPKRVHMWRFRDPTTPTVVGHYVVSQPQQLQGGEGIPKVTRKIIPVITHDEKEGVELGSIT